MWNLPIPKANKALQELDRALKLLDGTPVHTRSSAEKLAVRQLYRRYRDRRGRVHADLLGPTLSAALRNAIYNAFAETQLGGRLQSLRDRLKLAAPRCPFCSIGPVTDLDHHLPRGNYRALSIYCKNLIPACGTCNNKKRAVGGLLLADQFVHAYLEKLPNRQFFKATAEMVGNALVVDFEVVPVQGLPTSILQRLRRQVNRLDLNNRYAAEINVFVVSQQDGMELAYGPTQDRDQVQEFLKRTARRHKRAFGTNDWRTALLRALAKCEPFCDGGFQQIGPP